MASTGNIAHTFDLFAMKDSVWIVEGKRPDSYHPWWVLLVVANDAESAARAASEYIALGLPVTSKRFSVDKVERWSGENTEAVIIARGESDLLAERFKVLAQ